MRILMLSADVAWTGSNGGRSRRVARLADALARDGVDVTVLAPQVEGRPAHSVAVACDLPPRVQWSDGLTVALHGNNAMLAEGARIVSERRPDLLHVHDWTSVWAAAALKETFGLPLISTIHRLPAGWDRIGHQAAWWLAFVSRRTIVHSPREREQVEATLDVPHGKQDVIAPGRGSWRWVAARTRATYERALTEEDNAMWPALRRDPAAFRAMWERRATASR